MDDDPDFVPKIFKLLKICRAKLAGVVMVLLSEFKLSFDLAGLSARFVDADDDDDDVVAVIGGGVGDILYLVVGFVEIFGIV